MRYIEKRFFPSRLFISVPTNLQGSYKLFCCAKTILSVMSVKSFVRHHSYMVSSFIFINNFHISQLGKNIARGETLLLVNSCFFLSFSVFMDHISCGLVTKKKVKGNCSPSSAKTDSRHQQQQQHHLGFFIVP